MGLFDGLDVTDVSTFAEPVRKEFKTGPQPAVLDKVERQDGSKNNPDGKFLIFTYSNPEWPFTLTEYKEIPLGNPATWSRTKVLANGKTEFEAKDEQGRYLRARLLSLGVPPERINTVNPEELKGIQVIVTVRKRGDFHNVGDVSLPGTSGVTLPTTPEVATAANPAAGAPNAALAANPFAAGL